MKHSRRHTTFSAIKPIITNIKEVIQSMFSDYKGIKTRKQLQIDSWKIPNCLEIKQHTLNTWMKEEVSKEKRILN